MPSTQMTSVSLVIAIGLMLSALFQVYRNASQPDSSLSDLLLNDRFEIMACRSLSTALPGKVSVPSGLGPTSSAPTYFSEQQQDLTPACIVVPQSTVDVAKAIEIINKQYLESHEIFFAIRSGGHGLPVGASNVQGGVTLDLSMINQVSVSEDNSYTIIGSGARWRDVYQKLDSLNLAVAGGRASSVGVGGLILGGGISFYSPRTGFVCDNILNFEVVLSNGTVVNANETSHKDLWVALKGGGNNFGVVTRFTARTFPSQKLWGGSLYFSMSTAQQQLRAFHTFAQPESYDEASSAYLAIGYTWRVPIPGIVVGIQNTRAQKNPPGLQMFTSIKRFWSTAKVKTLSAAAKEIDADNPLGYRQMYMTTTVENDPATLSLAYERFGPALTALKSTVKRLTYSLVLQPLPPSIHGRGQNSLGISTNSTLVIVLLAASWKNLKDDQAVVAESENFFNHVNDRASAMGTANRYRYMNYAWQTQDVFTGYGPESHSMLQEVSRRYDPQGLFQKACTGGFKLFNEISPAYSPS